jgi:hypothetical protein
MKLDKLVIALSIFVVASMGISPIFAADPTNTGTSQASLGVSDTISLLVSGDVSLTSLLADNIITNQGQKTTLTSESNVPITVDVNATDFADNMPISALQVQNANTTLYSPMVSTGSVNVITGMSVPAVGASTTQDIGLQAQVPYGVKTGTYNTVLTWTASKTA